MFEIFLCVRDDHDIRLVALAAFVCMMASATSILMMRYAARSGREAGRRWMAAAGLACGFGIWTTHFIAMLGYDPGVVAGYHPALTAGSLAVVLITTTAGFSQAIATQSWRGLMGAAALTGGGFAAMHYLGMAALEMPAAIVWNQGYVLLSVVLAVVPLYPALAIAIGKRGKVSAAVAAALMAGAIIGLHFSGMTAIRLIPADMNLGAMLLSPHAMSYLLSAVSLLLLALCFAGWVIARRTDAAIAASRQQFSILVEGISDCAIYMLDPKGRIVSWNAGAERLKGYRQAEVLGLPLATFYTLDDRTAGAPDLALATALSCGKFSGEGWRMRKDGTCFWAHVVIERIIDEHGRHAGFAKITRDMSQFKEDQDRIAEAQGQLNAALEHMHQGLCLFDADERLVLTNRRFAQLWNLPEGVCVPGMTLTELARVALEARTGMGVPTSRLESMYRLLEEALANPDLPPVIAEFGSDFSVSISSRVRPEGGWVSTFEDVTERRRSEARIAHLAHHDVLTGLPNRANFNGWLDEAILAATRDGLRVAVAVIDLNDFKDVNDQHGHAIGDAVLQRFGAGLSELVRENEFAARLGGDEFAIAKLFKADPELIGLARRIEDCLALQASASGEIVVDASIGIACFPADAGDREALLSNADLAMYRAKSDPGRSICYFERGMDDLARRRRQLAQDMRQAIVRGEFELLYQEQRLLATEALSGYEALLRWHHPLLGSISPMEFIPIAEETGEIIKIGEWVLRTACTEAALWPQDLTVAVNLSPVQLIRPDLPELVAEILVQTGLPPRRLELEITETAIIADKVRALHSLRRIKALGVKVAMDDFGTGYSSLDTLHSFPFDKLKIDKSFLHQSETSDQAKAIIRAVLALGRNLGIPVLAEGVETEAQLSLLVAEGCHEAQGYYFGRPGHVSDELRQAANG